VNVFKFLKGLLGEGSDRELRRIAPIVTQINALEPTMERCSDAELAAYTPRFKERLADGETLDDILPEAYAVVRETSKRLIGQRHYDVQLIGGITLHSGRIAEMRTGEGKTLVATLPLYLNALTGRGVHLVTVNDYLVRVGAGWMAPIFHTLGLSVAVIAHDFSAVFDPEYTDADAATDDRRLIHWRPSTRREAYHADITYCTNSEIGFDYLRDNMVFEEAQLVQRKLHYAIVDEIDNILIDEARTPLIISGPAQESSQEYRRFAQLVRNLKLSTVTPDQVKRDEIEPDGDFMIDPRSKNIQMTEEGILKVERLLRIPAEENLYDPKYFALTHYLENALRAQFIYHRDKDYMVEGDGEVVIVDEFTGRKMPGRRWSDGLHQAIEAKEGVKMRQENVTLASITYQNFFRMYEKLGGMTGTADTEREEFAKIYNLEVTVIPTHRPTIRKDMSDLIYRTEAAKFNAVIQDIHEQHAAGRPVLVGTTSVETSERLSVLLKKAGIAHNVLNAKQHEREANVIAQAGRSGTVTIATNMAGRGTDILLGGNPDGLVEEILLEQKIAPADATPSDVAAALVIAKQRTDADKAAVVAAGGLHVVGTERHEARRIDNQLRGRAGRQGDPGSTRFYLALEDELMRRFGPMDRVKSLMERLGVDDDVPIEAGLINKSIENAQTRVEGYNFDVRKHTVEFDDVMNQQRKIIYADRRAILDGENLRERMLTMLSGEVESLVEQHLGDDPDEWDLAPLMRPLRMVNPLLPADIENELIDLSRQEIIDELHAQLENAYETREKAIGIDAMRYVERRMLLGIIDRHWIDYLTGMEDLRQEIGLQAIAQRDPLVEYRREAYSLFDQLKANIERDVVYQIVHVSFQYEQTLRQIEAEQLKRLVAAQQAQVADESPSDSAPKTVRNDVKLPGRNDPCPCGSGKKFKVCHLGREQELIAQLSKKPAAQPVAKSSPVARGKQK
jgi:preprotein translocase subunit SecA